MVNVLLRSVTLADGSAVDVALRNGVIAAVAPAGSLNPADQAPAEHTHDLAGWLLLPAPGEPHAHLDKALTADVVPNPDGDLMGAIVNYQARYHERTVPEIVGRARRGALADWPTGAPPSAPMSISAPTSACAASRRCSPLRDELVDRLDLQIVGLAGRPTAGPEGEENRLLLRQALEAGIDVGGGCPHLDPDPSACLRDCFDLAREFDRPVDLHMDEHLSTPSTWTSATWPIWSSGPATGEA